MNWMVLCFGIACVIAMTVLGVRTVLTAADVMGHIAGAINNLASNVWDLVEAVRALKEARKPTKKKKGQK